jgi:hypothetical protein
VSLIGELLRFLFTLVGGTTPRTSGQVPPTKRKKERAPRLLSESARVSLKNFSSSPQLPLPGGIVTFGVRKNIVLSNKHRHSKAKG